MSLYEVRPELLDAQAIAESGGNPRAVSPKGALGLHQFMPETWKQYGGGGNPFNPEHSREAAKRYLGDLLDMYNGDEVKAMAAYNAGPGRINSIGGDLSKAPQETRGYLAKISHLLNPVQQASSSETPYSEPRIALIKVPDGRTMKLKVPGNATPEEISKQAEILYNQLQPTQPQQNIQQSTAQPKTVQTQPQQPQSLQQSVDWQGSTGTIPEQNTPWADVASGAARNLIPGIGNKVIGTGKAIWNAPETLSSIAEALGPDLPKTLKTLGQAYIDRYGSLEGFKQSLMKDPTDVLSDVAIAIPMGTKLKPSLKVSPKAEELLNAGVELTPGQMRGGFLKTMEDKLTSAPLTGYQINQRRNEALAAFNKNEVNKALTPINATIPKGIEAGNETINAAYNELSKVYNDALDGVKITLNKPLIKSIGQTGANTSLPPGYASKLKSELNNILHPIRSGIIDGNTYKEVISNLNQRIRKYIDTKDPLDDYVAEHLNMVKANLNNVLAVPGVFDKAGATDPLPTLAKLKAADTAFAKMVPIEKAAAATGNQHGVFSANTLLRKATGGPSNLRATARGTGYNQQSLMNAQDILPSKIADSGTPGRMAAMGLLSGTTGLSAINPAFITPIATDMTGALLGTKLAQRAIVKPLLFGEGRMTPLKKTLIMLSKDKQE
jgi:hypothetical protein